MACRIMGRFVYKSKESVEVAFTSTKIQVPVTVLTKTAVGVVVALVVA